MYGMKTFVSSVEEFDRMYRTYKKTTMFDPILMGFTSTWENMKNRFKTDLDDLIALLRDKYPELTKALEDIWDVMSTPIEMPGIVELEKFPILLSGTPLSKKKEEETALSFYQKLKEAIDEFFKNTLQSIDNFDDALSTTFTGMGNVFKSGFSDVIKGELDSLEDAFARWGEFVINVVTDVMAQLASQA